MADIVYPLYLVIDASKSMNVEIEGKKRIDLARSIPEHLLKLYEEDNSLVSSVQVSLITFNTEATCILELGEIPKLRSMSKAFEAKSKTYYGKAFGKVFERINADYARLSKTTQFMKPAVVFVTDGRPNDEIEERNAAYGRLVPLRKADKSVDLNVFPSSPQIFMLGIGAADMQVLEAYASKKQYAHKASDAMGVDEQIRTIADKIKGSVSGSLADPQMDPEEDWMKDLFDSDDDDLLFF